MKEAKILLLDYNPEGGLADPLWAILAPSFPPGEQLRRITLEHFASDPKEAGVKGGEGGRGRWLKEAGDFKPHLLFVTLASGQHALALRAVASLRMERPEAAVVPVVGACAPAEVIELLRAGAADVFAPPLDNAETLSRVRRQLEQVARHGDLTHALKEKMGLQRLVGGAANFLSEIMKIPLVARTDGRILITGETGTGKELCARAIHYLSPRAARPFVAVNCGAIPFELVENELFGHERGAYTGAHAARHGLIREAEGGTLFLDEIDCLPALAQTKLLRFLQEHEYRPLGSARVRHADVRVIAASNVDPEEAMRDGRLRRDLYYRMNIIPLALPPLRERREDIPMLARYFLAEYAAEFDRPAADISPEAMRALLAYHWPGNVRELEHTMERAVMLCGAEVIGGGDISLPGPERAHAAESFRQAKARFVAQFEKSFVEDLLILHEGNISSAARGARKNRRAFWQLIRKHQIDVRRFKPDAS